MGCSYVWEIIRNTFTIMPRWIVYIKISSRTLRGYIQICIPLRYYFDLKANFIGDSEQEVPNKSDNSYLSNTDSLGNNPKYH